jgi:hypothetical protein
MTILKVVWNRGQKIQSFSLHPAGNCHWRVARGRPGIVIRVEHWRQAIKPGEPSYSNRDGEHSASGWEEFGEVTSRLPVLPRAQFCDRFAVVNPTDSSLRTSGSRRSASSSKC